MSAPRCDTNNVNCANPECRSMCGWIQWFGNLSDCTVILQYQMQPGGLWHSLGEYGPGQSTELGGGILMLPQEVNLRAIQKPTDPAAPPKVVSNWGRLGTSLQSLYVGGDKCRATASPTTPATTVTEASRQDVQDPRASGGVSGALVLAVFVVAAAAVGAALYSGALCRLDKKRALVK